MKKNLEPRNWIEQRFISCHRALGVSDEEISHLLKKWRFAQFMCGLIAGIALFLYGCLMVYIAYLILFVG